MAPIKTTKRKNYSVKQTFHTSMEMNARIIKYTKSKGVKPPFLFMEAVNKFLTENNF